jgi:glycine cleavage system regulatory protein
MPVTLVLTMIGDDRPGLVDAVSQSLAAHGGNWEQSHMASLAGKFAGILRASVPSDAADAVIRDWRLLEQDGLRIVVERGADGDSANRGWTLELEIVGQDHPGIVHDIAHALAQHRVSVLELDSEVVSASMAGGQLLQARISALAPDDLNEETLRDDLEALANELMVDLSWSESKSD